MSLLTVLLVLVIVGVCLYFIETYIPMSPPIKTLIRVIVVIFIVLWLLQIFGIVGPTIGSLRTR